MSIDYKTAGVNIDEADKIISQIKPALRKTFNANVLSGIGGFGALYSLKAIINDYNHPILVQSIDGVGTKVMVARLMDKFDTIGIDLVNNVVGDIVAMGAKPLTFLDYVASAKLESEIVVEIIKGIAKACEQTEIALIGGETAEMPGIYKFDEHDIVGTATGILEYDQAITGEKIKTGDAILGFASNGIHTNGFSLAREIFFTVGGYKVNSYLAELGETVGETLLKPHLNYALPIARLLESGIKIKGISHITGGGLVENIPRILPNNLLAKIDKKSWPKIPVFDVMKMIGDVEEYEMFRTFNMGIGMALVVAENEADEIIQFSNGFSSNPSIYRIGYVTTKPI